MIKTNDFWELVKWVEEVQAITNCIKLTLTGGDKFIYEKLHQYCSSNDTAFIYSPFQHRMILFINPYYFNNLLNEGVLRIIRGYHRDTPNTSYQAEIITE